MLAINEHPPPPAPTPPPALLVDFTERHLSTRQTLPNASCTNVGNDVLSCYPAEGEEVFQNSTMHFVWNRNFPSFAQLNSVDVYLYHADTLKQAATQKGLVNNAGRTAFPVNDSWWDERGSPWRGQNISYPMYFIVVQAGHALDGSEEPQATFTAIQTRQWDSFLATASTTATASGASGSIMTGPNGQPMPTGLQNASDDSGLPQWGKALIATTSVLAFLLLIVVFFLIVRCLRQKKERRIRPDSMGSSVPIMQESTGPPYPTVGAVPLGEPTSPIGSAEPGSSSTHPIFGAAGISRARSTATGTSSHRELDPNALFSEEDALTMAAAFRETLRKPDFANRPIEEGESPDQEGEDQKLARELKEEGRDLRSVSSSRVRVEGDQSEVGTVRGDGRRSIDSR